LPPVPFSAGRPGFQEGEGRGGGRDGKGGGREGGVPLFYVAEVATLLGTATSAI